MILRPRWPSLALDALATIDPARHDALTKWIDNGGEMPRRSGT